MYHNVLESLAMGLVRVAGPEEVSWPRGGPQPEAILGQVVGSHRSPSAVTGDGAGVSGAGAVIG